MKLGDSKADALSLVKIFTVVTWIHGNMKSDSINCLQVNSRFNLQHCQDSILDKPELLENIIQKYVFKYYSELRVSEST